MVKDYRTRVSDPFKKTPPEKCPNEPSISNIWKISNNEQKLRELNTWASELDGYLIACREAVQNNSSSSHIQNSEKLNTKVILLQNIMDVSTKNNGNFFNALTEFCLVKKESCVLDKCLRTKRISSNSRANHKMNMWIHAWKKNDNMHKNNWQSSTDLV